MMRYYLLLFLLSVITTVSAEVTEELNYRYYTAKADSDKSLLAILNAATPISRDNQLYHGYTKWYVRWNYRWFEQANRRCKITNVTTKVTGDIQLPKLVNATDEQAILFERYVAALREHELGHYHIGKEAAVAIDQAIFALPEMSSCQLLESTANGLGYQLLDEYRAKEIQYDKDTEHGKTQGAWLDR